MNPISGVATMPTLDLKELMVTAVAAQTQQAVKTATLSAAMKVSNPAGGLDVWA